MNYNLNDLNQISEQSNFYKNNKKLLIYQHNTIGYESIWIELTYPNNKQILFCSFYRNQLYNPHIDNNIPSSAILLYFYYFSLEIQEAKKLSPHIIIGDFNCQHVVWGATY